MTHDEETCLYVAQGVKLEAYKSFLVKPSANWDPKYGAGSVNYIKANKWFTSVKDGADITVEAAGTAYDSATEASPVLLFKPNSNWYGNSKRCSAYFFNNSGNTWVSMTEISNSGVYLVRIPQGYTFGDNVIFCSMNKNNTYNNWDNKWNQTVDLTIPKDGKNFFTANGGWDGVTGTWSKKQ